MNRKFNDLERLPTAAENLDRFSPILIALLTRK